MSLNALSMRLRLCNPHRLRQVGNASSPSLRRGKLLALHASLSTSTPVATNLLLKHESKLDSSLQTEGGSSSQADHIQAIPNTPSRTLSPSSSAHVAISKLLDDLPTSASSLGSSAASEIADGLDSGNLRGPASQFGKSRTRQQFQSYNSPRTISISPYTKLPVPRTGPSAGRSVAVRNGDVPAALARLATILRENNVQAMYRYQKYHERKGLKKKRLKSERHRKRFKEGFKRMVRTVMEMRLKGL